MAFFNVLFMKSCHTRLSKSCGRYFKYKLIYYWGYYLYSSSLSKILLTTFLSCQDFAQEFVIIECSSPFPAIKIISSFSHINIAVLIAISLSGIIQKSSHCFLSIQGKISFIIS
jgi:hypothetical protein